MRECYGCINPNNACPACKPGLEALMERSAPKPAAQADTRLPIQKYAAPIEHKIAVCLIINALALPGATISVNDGEEWTVKESNDIGKVWAALATTDSDVLRVHLPDGTTGSVVLIWGNGVDLISDWTDNELADKLCDSVITLFENHKEA